MSYLSVTSKLKKTQILQCSGLLTAAAWSSDLVLKSRNILFFFFGQVLVVKFGSNIQSEVNKLM